MTGKVLVFGCLFLCITVLVNAEQNHYHVLGVSRQASLTEIKQSYKKLARKWHPDKNKSKKAQQNFIRISSAYEVLSDSRKRADYDRSGYSTGLPSNNFYQNHHYQYGRQRSHYSFHTSDNQFSSSSVSPVTALLFLGALILILPAVLQQLTEAFEEDKKQTKANTSSTTSSKPTTTPNSPQKFKDPSGPYATLAKTYAPSVHYLQPQILGSRGKRIVIFFPKKFPSCLTHLEQWSLMEKLSQEFSRDPLIFTWMDTENSIEKKNSWNQYFTKIFPEYSDVFLMVTNANGKKSAIYTGSNTLDNIRNWLSRLVGGEISLIDAGIEIPL